MPCLSRTRANHLQARGNATVAVNNPTDVAYVATIPSAAFDAAAFPEGGNIKGSIWAQARPDGIGVVFKVNFSNLPKTGGPFSEARPCIHSSLAGLSFLTAVL